MVFGPLVILAIMLGPGLAVIVRATCAPVVFSVGGTVIVMLGIRLMMKSE